MLGRFFVWSMWDTDITFVSFAFKCQASCLKSHLFKKEGVNLWIHTWRKVHLKLAGLWTNKKTTDSVEGIDSLGPASTEKVCQISRVPTVLMFFVAFLSRKRYYNQPGILTTFPYSIHQKMCFLKRNMPWYASSIPGILEISLRTFRFFTGGFELVLGASPGTLGTGRACWEPQRSWTTHHLNLSLQWAQNAIELGGFACFFIFKGKV